MRREWFRRQTMIAMKVVNRMAVWYALIAVVLIAAVDHRRLAIDNLNAWADSASGLEAEFLASSSLGRKQLLGASRFYNYYKMQFPGSPVGYNNRAICYYFLGSLPSARRELDAGLRVSPQSFGLRYNLGVLYYRQGRWREAVEVMKPALSLPMTDAVKEKLLLGLESGLKDKMTNMVIGVSIGYLNGLKMMVASYVMLGDAQGKAEACLALQKMFGADAEAVELCSATKSELEGQLKSKNVFSERFYLFSFR